MNFALIVVATLLCALLVWLAADRIQRRKELLEEQMSRLHDELQSVAAAQAQSAGQIQTMGQNVSQRLDGVTQALQNGVTDSAQIATQGQTAVATELRNTREQIGLIQKQIGEVQEQSRELALATQSLEGILGGARSRGRLGEMALETLLEDSLPQCQFGMQHRFTSGEVADAVVFLRDGKVLAIDSKFPLDAFRRIVVEGDEARRAFATAVKGHADSIARKYIVPDEGTLDLALMFVPSENVYCELLETEDAKGQQIDAYCREKRIIAVSPNSLYAHLSVIHMGLRGMQMEENAKQLFASLSGMQKQMSRLADVFTKLGMHLKNAQQCYSEADRRFEKARNTISTAFGADSDDPPLAGSQGTSPIVAIPEGKEPEAAA